MIFYRPFNHPIEYLGLADVQALIDREQEEGWFLEFKEELPSGKTLYQAVSAFANSAGGGAKSTHVVYEKHRVIL